MCIHFIIIVLGVSIVPLLRRLGWMHSSLSLKHHNCPAPPRIVMPHCEWLAAPLVLRLSYTFSFTVSPPLHDLILSLTTYHANFR
jgi:hypothetical protein